MPATALCAVSLAVGLSVAGPPSAAAAGTPTPLIIDTDIFSNADDVGAIATAFALQTLGEDQVIAITVNTRTSRPAVATDSWKCAAAIAQYYNSPGVPIGADMPDDGPSTNSPDFITPCAALASPSTPKPASAVSVLRSALASQPDGSVVIAEIGYEENLQALLNSPGDSVSPLTGSALVALKVKTLVVMGGEYPSTMSAENNFAGNPAAATAVAANWPTTVVYSGYEVGNVVQAGHTIDSVQPTNSPLRAAYDAYAGPNTSIQSWDLTTVYHAVRPGDADLTETGPGTNTVDPTTGTDVFATGTGTRYYLSLLSTNVSSLESSLENLLDVVPPVPVESSPPSVNGVATQGQTLTEAHGSWSNSPTSYAYQWQDCDSTGANCQPITGSTGQTYVLTATDVGSTIRVVETARNDAGAGSPATSNATLVVSQAVPVEALPPAILGVATQGQWLTEVHGSWSITPTAYAYQWQRCDSTGANCQPITSATGQTYALEQADVGSTIQVVETARDAGGWGTPAQSDLTAVVSASNAGGSGPPATSTPASVTVPPASVTVPPPSLTANRPTARLAKAQISSKHASATFHFAATGPATGFQCALVRRWSGKHRATPAPKYASCSATKTFKHLAIGQYVLYVRAVGPAGASSTPAIDRFKITRPHR